MDFNKRFDHLNLQQQSAVQTIDGPLLVIAGPGTGKTELLSMRTAYILKQTDTLPANILCLTFTDSAATNMRQRLSQIIGEDAYKVAIHTFHSFGTEIIANHREYFFRGSDRRPSDDLRQMQIVSQLFEQLDTTNVLASRNDEQFVHLSDAQTAISEFKKSGLTPDELRSIIADNQRIIDQLAPAITEVFADKITKRSLEPFTKLAQMAAEISPQPLPIGIASYSETIALSLAHTAQAALADNSTKPITAWKSTWCKKDTLGNTVLKDALAADKLLEVINLYEAYEKQLEQQQLFDYDDMILTVLSSLRAHPDLRATIREQYQYILVDEFQDTSLAQLRLLFELTGQGREPNVMAVGDDDQAVYSFQGADIGNIQRFRDWYDDPPIIVLTDNYRSTSTVLTSARAVITQGTDRLEHTIQDLSKELTAHHADETSRVAIRSYASTIEERAEVARHIKHLIDNGEQADNIAVLARKHHELISLVPYLTEQGIAVNYERSDDVFEQPIIQSLELLGRVVSGLMQHDHDLVNALLPKLLAQPSFDFAPVDIWRLSLDAYKNRQFWLEAMLASSVFSDYANWLMKLSQDAQVKPLELVIDQFLGGWSQDGPSLMKYHFSPSLVNEQPEQYLLALEALRTLRNRLREHFADREPKLTDMISFIDLHRSTHSRMPSARQAAYNQVFAINLMSAHKAKGLEFKHVFVIGATDNTWGEKARDRSRLIRYPANVPLAPVGATYDERLRLFFVAMTRAKTQLYISFSRTDGAGREQLIASFLSGSQIEAIDSSSSTTQHIEQVLVDWRGRLSQPISSDLKTLLAPTLESYKLSATHLGNFLDVSRGGPQTFLLNNLLRFPQAKSAAASYGTAIHACLQYAHNAFKVDGSLPPLSAVLDQFRRALTGQHLSTDDTEQYLRQGEQTLTAFWQARSDTFSPNQRTEVSFASQGIRVGEARLTGALDLVDIDTVAKTVVVTDYKTGRPSRNWKGTSDYEKIKLHKYRQQLMFYQLLVEGSRDFSSYQFTEGVLQFVEPESRTGEILALSQSFSSEELARFRQLIERVWSHITKLELPDVSQYSADYRGMMQFEEDLLAEY